ncbi:hypothetical protein OYE22_17780 [Streptomyces sp. 71268]|uniref:hypothetical protein n=1 Tax=Streptomyces sp. 71268 TaxID=3002640 RepID=UPI0023F8C7FD|nr:hypothetical protein [Streptomyces sp. 71268]WEV26840.1 hypothetical protein OYE22_17780 [Streptomyces sp. 71268]
MSRRTTLTLGAASLAAFVVLGLAVSAGTRQGSPARPLAARPDGLALDVSEPRVAGSPRGLPRASARQLAAAEEHADRGARMFVTMLFVGRANGKLELVPLYGTFTPDGPPTLIDTDGRAYEGGMDDFRAHNDLFGPDDEITYNRVLETGRPGDATPLLTKSGHTRPDQLPRYVSGGVAIAAALGGTLLLARRARRAATEPVMPAEPATDTTTTPVTGVADATSAPEAADATNITHGTDTMDTMDTAEAVDPADATDRADLTDPADTIDLDETTGAPDVT